MKYQIKRCLTVTALLFVHALCMGQSKIIDAETQLKQASAKATREKKEIMLVFYASWNPWSEVLKNSLNNPEIKKILDKSYVICQMNIRENKLETKKLEAPGGIALFERYNKYVDTTFHKENRKIPTVITLDSKLNRIAQFTGFPEEQSGADTFVKILNLSLQDKNAINEKILMDYKKVAPPSASELLKKAGIQAKTENKKIFVMFTASWCHWCHVLDTAINHPSCKKIFNDKFVFVHLIAHEGDSKLINQQFGAMDLLAKYQGNKSNGIPFSVILDHDGKLLGKFHGFQTPVPKSEASYKEFEALLKTSVNMSDAELVTIKTAFLEVSKKNGL